MERANLALIGLTGNIACGKSTIARILNELGAQVCDADQVTHQLQEPGQPIYTQIVEVFGPGILLQPGGTIDRRKLGALVFQAPAQLKQLEAIVHPAVRQVLEAWLQQVAVEGISPVAVIEAVKLLEAGWKGACQAVWVVTCSQEEQVKRLIKKRGLGEAEAWQRIAAQPTPESRLALADVIIDNSGPLLATQRQVEAAWQAFVQAPPLNRL